MHGHEHILSADADGTGVQPHAGTTADRFTGAKVELTVATRTFDDVIHDQSVREVNLFMGAMRVSAEERALRASVDGRCLIFMVEADQVLGLDMIPCPTTHSLGH